MRTLNTFNRHGFYGFIILCIYLLSPQGQSRQTAHANYCEPVLPKPPCQLLRGRKPEYTDSSKIEKTLLGIERAASHVKDKWFNNSTSPFKPLDLHGTEIV